MTTVVPTSEEDPVLSVVRFTAEMSWAEAGPEVAEPQVSSLCLEAQEFMIAGRWLDLASLMITSADLVFSKASEKDLECIFTIICNLVKKPESLDELLEMAKLLSSKIAQQPNDKPALRLKILFNLYNLLEHPYSRFYVYMKALKLATDGKVIEHIIPSFKKIDSFLKEWDLGVNPQISSSPSSNLPCISRSVKPLFNLCNAAKFASRHLVTRLLIPRLRFSSRPKSSSRNGWDFEATKWVCNCSPQSIDLHILLLVNIMCHSPLPPFLNIIVFHCTNKGLKNHVADGRTLLGCFADCYDPLGGLGQSSQ